MKWAAAKSLPKIRCRSAMKRWSKARWRVLNISIVSSKVLWTNARRIYSIAECMRLGARNLVASAIRDCWTIGWRHFSLFLESAIRSSISANGFASLVAKYSGSSSCLSLTLPSFRCLNDVRFEFSKQLVWRHNELGMSAQRMIIFAVVSWNVSGTYISGAQPLVWIIKTECAEPHFFFWHSQRLLQMT